MFITNLVDGKKVPLMHSKENPGLNVRDWLHVDDNCAAIYHLVKHGVPGQAYNIGGGNERTNMTITKALLADFKVGDEMIQFVEHRKGHDFKYSIDSGKLVSTGFKAQHKNFEKALQDTVAWYRANENWWRPLKK